MLVIAEFIGRGTYSVTIGGVTKDITIPFSQKEIGLMVEEFLLNDIEVDRDTILAALNEAAGEAG